VRDVEIGGREFVVIAGPCSVETREQIDQIAGRVGCAGAALFRAGAFKPRTSPYAFQGLGAEGLAMLAEAVSPALPVVTEALDAEQLERIAGTADVVQIGARNMHNTSLLCAAAACGRPVLLKRGFAATIDELLLAAEYLLAHGNPHVLLCERGIRTFERATRNTADLASVALLKRLTHLPVLVDPSHATGRADLVAPVAHAALAVGADGVMIEVHHQPARSWSDADQAIDCDAFDDLMRSLNNGTVTQVDPLNAMHGQWYEGRSRLISQPAYTPESSRRGSLQSRSIRMERIRSDARAPLIYRRARNLHAVQPLVWHAKLDSAVRYRGISGFRDAIDSVLERRRSGFKLGLHCGMLSVQAGAPTR